MHQMSQKPPGQLLRRVKRPARQKTMLSLGLRACQWRHLRLALGSCAATSGRATGGSQGPVPRPSGAIRESRPRPYGTPCGRLGGRPVCDGWQSGPVPRRGAQFVNLDKNPMERRAAGLAAGRCAMGGSQGPCPGEGRNS